MMTNKIEIIDDHSKDSAVNAKFFENANRSGCQQLETLCTVSRGWLPIKMNWEKT